MENITKSHTETFLYWFGNILLTIWDVAFYSASLLPCCFNFNNTFPSHPNLLELVQMEDGKNKILASGC